MATAVVQFWPLVPDFGGSCGASGLVCDESFLDDDCQDLGADCLTADSNISTTLSDISFSGSLLPDQHSCQAKDQTSKSAAGSAGFDELLLEQQDANMCPSSYLSITQAATGLTPAHRATTVDGMIAASARLGLNNDSLFTAVALLDRLLAVKPVLLPLLQPTAIACLWVASKYEQLVVPPVVHYAVQVQSGSEHALRSNSVHLSKQLLVELEGEILAALDYRLAAIVTVKGFKGCLMHQLHTSKAAAAMSRRQLDQLYCMTSYLTEVSLLEYRLLPFKPSQVASAAFVYAHVLLGLQVSSALQLTGSTLAELTGLLEIFCALHSTLSAALHLSRPYNVTAKYRNPAVGCVANIPPMTIPAEQRVGGW